MPRGAGWACLLVAGCSGDGEIVFGGDANPVDRPAQCSALDFPAPGDPDLSQSLAGVVEGTEDPSVTPLTAGQRRAIASVWTRDPPAVLCSATFIGPDLLASAAHCFDDSCTEPRCRGRFRVRLGDRPNRRDPGLEVDGWAVDERLDLAWIRLVEPPADPVTPIPLSPRLRTPEELLDVPVEAAGHGLRFDGDSELRFGLTTVLGVPGEEVQVDGRGRGGLCFGDSGGPLLWIAPEDDRVEIVGVLSRGSTDCLGQDLFTQVGAAPGFFEAQGPTPRAETPRTCETELGPVREGGRCAGADTVLTCAEGRAASVPCTGGTVCNVVSERAECTPVDSACDGLPAAGDCEGNVLTWCDKGEVRQRDCGACQEQCAFSESTQAHTCLADICGRIGEAGRCAGDVLEYCDPVGRFRQVDCRQFGQRCATVDGNARCAIPPGTCDEIGFRGRCEGDVAVFCEDGGFFWTNCDSLGATCGFIDDDIGFFCVPR